MKSTQIVNFSQQKWFQKSYYIAFPIYVRYPIQNYMGEYTFSYYDRFNSPVYTFKYNNSILLKIIYTDETTYIYGLTRPYRWILAGGNVYANIQHNNETDFPEKLTWKSYYNGGKQFDNNIIYRAPHNGETGTGYIQLIPSVTNLQYYPTYNIHNSSGNIITSITKNQIITLPIGIYYLELISVQDNANIQPSCSIIDFAIQKDKTTKICYFTECLCEGTLITLDDGSIKPIQDITYDDQLLVWNFDERCYDKANPAWIKQQQIPDHYFKSVLDDGTQINTVGTGNTAHRLFINESNSFQYFNNSVNKHTYTLNGTRQLISCTRIDKPVKYYNVITKKHFNLFANGILTSCHLNNLYPIKDMKFIKNHQKNNFKFDLPEQLVTDLRLNQMAINEEKYVKRMLSQIFPDNS